MAEAARDDSRHSLLGKAHALSQSTLAAFLERENGLATARLPRDEFGHYEVREVEVKSALTKCAMPGEPWSLNPYMGCSHDCAYCYVPDVAHVERPKWGSYVIVKRNLPTLLAREMARKPERPVFLSSATDPYQPVEGTHLVTRRCLEVLARHDWPLRVLTRNPLVRRDIPLFKQFSDVGVGLSVPTLDDDMRRLLEPGAPTVEARLRTLRALADEGLRPYANLSPAYPLSGCLKPADIAQAFREAGVVHVYAAPWRYLRTVLPVLRERLPEDVAREFTASIADPGYYERFFRSLRAAFRGTGIELVSMGTGPGMGARGDIPPRPRSPSPRQLATSG